MCSHVPGGVSRRSSASPWASRWCTCGSRAWSRAPRRRPSAGGPKGGGGREKSGGVGGLWWASKRVISKATKRGTAGNSACRWSNQLAAGGGLRLHGWFLKSGRPKTGWPPFGCPFKPSQGGAFFDFRPSSRLLSSKFLLALGVPSFRTPCLLPPPPPRHDTPLAPRGLYFTVIAAFSLLGNWAQSGTNFPILSDIVPPKHRSAWEQDGEREKKRERERGRFVSKGWKPQIGGEVPAVPRIPRFG